MAGAAYPKRVSKQNRKTTRAIVGEPVKIIRAGDIDYTFLFIVILLLAAGLILFLALQPA